MIDVRYYLITNWGRQRINADSDEDAVSFGREYAARPYSPLPIRVVKETREELRL